MATLKNHKGMFLNDAAAASLARLEDDHGVQPLTSAGRTEAYQQELINRWNKGGTYNRPPYLYEPKRPAREGAHVKNGGNAIDTTNWRHFLTISRDYGWRQTYDWDVVHFEYFPALDKHKGRENQGGNSAPTPAPLPKENEVAVVNSNAKEYNLSPGQIVAIKEINAAKTNQKVTKTPAVELKTEELGQQLDNFGIPRSYTAHDGKSYNVLDGRGWVLNPETLVHEEAGLWSWERRVIAELRAKK